MSKFLVDIILIFIALPFLAPLFLLTWLIVKTTSNGPALYWSKRVGRNSQLFDMPKFRSMQVNAPVIATHLMNAEGDLNKYLTPVGAVIRKFSLDEIPQIWSVFKGDMSIVGPRPALFNQTDLVKMREVYGVDKLKPGITGWAQINGRDEIPIEKKVELDVFYLNNQSILFDFYIILLTVIKVLNRDNVSH